VSITENSQANCTSILCGEEFMSTIGYISGNLEHSKDQLRNLSSAMLILEAASTGQLEKLNFSHEDYEKSRSIVKDFAMSLRDLLNSGETFGSGLESLISEIKSDAKMPDDWHEDLNNLVLKMDCEDIPTKDDLSIMNKVVSFIDTRFANNLRRLYSR
jgi:hypothetical protein